MRKPLKRKRLAFEIDLIIVTSPLVLLLSVMIGGKKAEKSTI